MASRYVNILPDLKNTLLAKEFIKICEKLYQPSTSLSGLASVMSSSTTSTSMMTAPTLTAASSSSVSLTRVESKLSISTLGSVEPVLDLSMGIHAQNVVQDSSVLDTSLGQVLPMEPGMQAANATSISSSSLFTTAAPITSMNATTQLATTSAEMVTKSMARAEIIHDTSASTTHSTLQTTENIATRKI